MDELKSPGWQCAKAQEDFYNNVCSDVNLERANEKEQILKIPSNQDGSLS